LIGGTGELGTALAVHFAKVSSVLLGSRDLEKSRSVVEKILDDKSNDERLRSNLVPSDNFRVVAECNIVILTVPAEVAIRTIKQLSESFRIDQILVSSVAPVEKTENGFVSKFDSKGRSVTQQISEILPRMVRVATAFQTIPAHILYEERPISADVLVSCNELTTYQSVATLVAMLPGLRPLYLGSLDYAGEIERITALLMNVAKRNRLKSPTLKFSSF
jgi:8-hydroxy-5-deazaflavin:NADPH oxidoreductase